MKKLMVVGTSLFLLGVTACVKEQHSYNGSGDMSDLIDARLQCVKENTNRGSSQVNVTVNVNSYANPGLSCGAFNMCMATKGYTKAVGDAGRLKVPDSMVISCNKATP